MEHTSHWITAMIEFLPASLGIDELKGIKQRGLFEKMDILNTKQMKQVKKRIKATTNKLDKQLDKLQAVVTVDPEKVKPRLKLADALPAKNVIPMVNLKEKADPPEEGARQSEETQAISTGVTTSPSAIDTRPSVDAEHLEGRPSTQLSRRSSNSSHHTHTSGESTDILDGIVGPAPVLDPAAAAAIDPALEQEKEEQEDDNAFAHPSTYKEQPWIWLPQDRLGFSKILVKELNDAGVDASDVGSTMDEKGVVEVSRNPPDQEWLGGHDR